MNTPAFRPSVIFGIATLLLALALGSYALWSVSRLDDGKGTALVGGPFTMVNHKGVTVTDKDFRGRPMLLFFGFTFCPDICPTELQVMAAARDQLGETGKTIQPIFVTIDPARDTVPVMSAYVSNFGADFVGLTGSAEQVDSMARIYRVFYQKQDNKADPSAYQMDHTSIIYLMGADGKFLKHFSYTTDAKALADGLRLALRLP
jgi:cytochrome oxidase Cu insertion factor (SCO1/SenC/PrrC family)